MNRKPHHLEAILLAGGLGTRLRSEVIDLPKSMAHIGSRPFLEYQMDQFIARGVTRFILSVGYKSESIRAHFSDRYRGCEVVFAVEETPLGTGGAIKHAMKYVTGRHVVVANGDSMFLADLQAQYSFHKDNNADITLMLKPLQDPFRYGTVELDPHGRIMGFLEKQPIEKGLINGGLYLFDVTSFRKLNLPDVFSLEKDLFEKGVDQLRIFGYVSEGYFIDIGIPEDYTRAQYEIGLFPQIDSTWTLFLDRDGVINKKLENDYVKTIPEFHFIPGTLEALAELSHLFGQLIIVTNQQGIGKGIMSEEDLQDIHRFMWDEIKQHGGRIDAIYHAPQLKSEGSSMRKPGTGMALQAKKDFPRIDFARSIMAGDSALDMEFAKRARMHSILISEEPDPGSGTYRVSSLREFSQILASIQR
jgi:D-glycero-alpha-D-manno-heptose 1-phosphate guanylyltransferase